MKMSLNIYSLDKQVPMQYFTFLNLLHLIEFTELVHLQKGFVRAREHFSIHFQSSLFHSVHSK